MRFTIQIYEILLHLAEFIYVVCKASGCNREDVALMLEDVTKLREAIEEMEIRETKSEGEFYK